jgi:hypothetical protein
MSEVNPFLVWALLVFGGLIYQAAKLSLGLGTIEQACEDLFDATYWSAIGIFSYWWMASP